MSAICAGGKGAASSEDRPSPSPPHDLDARKAEARRPEAAEIFARGCMQTAEDFYHGALVF